jgi:hypothetical protein
MSNYLSIQFHRHFSVHFSTSFTKVIVHCEVLEDIESGFRGDLFKLANQKQEVPVAAMFVNGLGQNVQYL